MLDVSAFDGIEDITNSQWDAGRSSHQYGSSSSAPPLSPPPRQANVIDLSSDSPEAYPITPGSSPLTRKRATPTWTTSSLTSFSAISNPQPADKYRQIPTKKSNNAAEVRSAAYKGKGKAVDRQVSLSDLFADDAENQPPQRLVPAFSDHDDDFDDFDDDVLMDFDPDTAIPPAKRIPLSTLNPMSTPASVPNYSIPQKQSAPTASDPLAGDDFVPVNQLPVKEREWYLNHWRRGAQTSRSTYGYAMEIGSPSPPREYKAPAARGSTAKAKAVGKTATKAKRAYKAWPRKKAASKPRAKKT